MLTRIAEGRLSGEMLEQSTERLSSHLFTNMITKMITKMFTKMIAKSFTKMIAKSFIKMIAGEISRKRMMLLESLV